MFCTSFFDIYGQFFIERLQLTYNFFTLLQLFLDSVCLSNQDFIFYFEIFSSAKPNTELVELILENGVIVVKSTDLTDVEIYVVLREMLG